MNPLLKRQISKYLPADLKGRQDLEIFLKSVEDSYDNLDDQFKMTQRAMKISSDELFEANKLLREETELQRNLLTKLQTVINTIQPFENTGEQKNIFENLEGKKLADYINEQAGQLIKVNKNQEKLLTELALQNQELNDYAHIVSHDLKSPLRSIEALMSWLIEEHRYTLDKEGKAYCELIVFHIEKMDALISGILEYSSIGKEIRVERELNLEVLVKETIELLNVPDHIHIKIHQLPIIKVDRFKWQQIFQNLIVNAINSIDKQEGFIDIISRDLDTKIQFEIKDNGKGIDPAYFEKIFQIFQKLENDSKSTGIGLSIVKKIINSYQGEIWLDSELGKGSSFYFTLPKTN
jgi:signal transduction histidine kinase